MKSILLSCFAASLWANAHAQVEDELSNGAFRIEEPSGALADADAAGWSTAPAVDGAVSWTVFGATEEILVDEGDGRVIKPVFSDAVKALEGRIVRVNGYMMPLEQSLRQSHFLVLAYPLHCPFCISAGPTQMVEVTAAEPVEFKYDAQLVEGRLELLTDDENGMYYRIVEARAVKR